MPLDARHAATSLHVAPPPTLSISSHLQSVGSEKQRLEKFSHSSTFSKFHTGAASATVIQRVWRSHISRLIQSDMRHLQRLVALERSVLSVQRCWRGHLGRFEAFGRISVLKHDRRIEEMNASASAVQSWYKSNLRRIVDEKNRLDQQKMLHEKHLADLALSVLRTECAVALQRFARRATANHSYCEQLMYIIRHEALAGSRDKAWVKLKGFFLIIQSKGIAARKRVERHLLLLKNDPNKASRVISRAIRRRIGQLMRQQWLTVGRFALATLRLQQQRKGAGFDVPKVVRSSNTKDDDDFAFNSEALEDALLQMELALRSQAGERQVKSADDNSVDVSQDTHRTPGHTALEDSRAYSERLLSPRLMTEPRKVAPAAQLHSKDLPAITAQAPSGRPNSSVRSFPPRMPVPGAAKRRNDTKKARVAVLSSLPVGSVVFSIRQLSEKKSLDSSGKLSLFKGRESRPRSTFAQVSELFSSSPSRSSSSAKALKQADKVRQSALNALQNRFLDENAGAPAVLTRGHGLEDDGDESSGQLPIGVLEAIMVRPHTKAVEQDKRLLKLALEAENRQWSGSEAAFSQQMSQRASFPGFASYGDDLMTRRNGKRRE